MIFKKYRFSRIILCDAINQKKFKKKNHNMEEEKSKKKNVKSPKKSPKKTQASTDTEKSPKKTTKKRPRDPVLAELEEKEEDVPRTLGRSLTSGGKNFRSTRLKEKKKNYALEASEPLYLIGVRHKYYKYKSPHQLIKFLIPKNKGCHSHQEQRFFLTCKDRG